MLAVVLPDSNGSYNYFLEAKSCCTGGCTTHHTNNTFAIIRENMFNRKSADKRVCDSGSTIWRGEFSYIRSVKWCDFIKNTEAYIDASYERQKNIDDYVKDELCGYRFTTFGFKDLFSLLSSVSSKEWYENVPKSLPIYLIAGDMDPVGNYGKGVKEVYEKLQKSGHTDVTIKLYEGYRHEIHNEDIRNDVLDGILEFAGRITK